LSFMGWFIFTTNGYIDLDHKIIQEMQTWGKEILSGVRTN